MGVGSSIDGFDPGDFAGLRRFRMISSRIPSITALYNAQ